jgi:hypothetical protein
MGTNNPGVRADFLEEATPEGQIGTSQVKYREKVVNWTSGLSQAQKTANIT